MIREQGIRAEGAEGAQGAEEEFTPSAPRASSASPPLFTTQIGLLYILYEQCVSRRTEPIPCDNCLRICLANRGEWPFDKCPIPPKRKRRGRR